MDVVSPLSLFGMKTPHAGMLFHTSLVLRAGSRGLTEAGELEIISFANQASGLYSQLLDSSFAIVDGELIWTYPDGYTGPEITLVGSDLYIDAENIARLNGGELEFIGLYDGTNYYVHPNRLQKTNYARCDVRAVQRLISV